MHRQPRAQDNVLSLSASHEILARSDGGFVPVHEVVARHAALRPEAIAVRCRGRSLTYGELNRRADQLARMLLGHGASPDSLVGLCLERSCELVIALLGIVKAGAAYLPIDPRHPRERISTQLHDAQVRLLITEEERADSLRDAGPQDMTVVSMELTAATANPSTEDRPLPVVSESHWLYAIYTSGSTGRPQGVLASHGNLAYLFRAMRQELDFTPQEIWTCCHSLAFGFSAWEIWGALLHGACVVIVPDGIRQSPESLTHLIRYERVTTLSLTPSMFRTWIEDPALRESSSLESLRRVVLSGEPLRREDWQRWVEHPLRRGVELLDTYALTETCGQVAWRRIPARDIADRGSVADELPDRPVWDHLLPGTLVHLLDEHQRPVAMGEVGEVCIESPGVTLGYLHSSDLTRSRFLEVPSAEGAESPGKRRIFRTGDRGRFILGGALELWGRVDGQVKLHGHRLELGEVESLLRNHPAVRDAAVLLREDDPGAACLVAYLVGDQAGVGDRGMAAAIAGADEQVEFWPSLGEYQVYDPFLYHLMTGDPVRNEGYRAAFRQEVMGKTVLDIGTGSDAQLAKLCIEAGARHVYATEVLPQAAERARAACREQGLADRITVLVGDSLSLEIPEPIDVVTQGIIGNIGSSDGIIPIWNDARQRLGNQIKAIPRRCETLVAGVCLPERLKRLEGFDPLPRHYAEEIFRKVGYRFDVRLCVRNFPREAVITDSAVFEDLDFHADIPVEECGDVTLTVTTDGVFEGLLLWTKVLLAPGIAVDYLANQQAWLPVYLPIAEPSVPVRAGTTVYIRWERRLGPDGVFPDYAFEVRLEDEAGALRTYRHVSRHHHGADDPHGVAPDQGLTELHRRLVGYDTISTQVATTASADASHVTDRAALRLYLANYLPEAMVPTEWVWVRSLPRNLNGKLDRSALPAPQRARHLRDSSGGDAARPRLSPLHEAVTEEWEHVLGRDDIALHDNFFALGGTSIQAITLASRLQQRLQTPLSVVAIFRHASIAELIEYLRREHPTAAFVDEPKATAPPTPPLVRSDTLRRREGQSVLSFAQERMWVAEHLAPGTAVYHLNLLHHLHGPLDVDALEASFRALITRHPTLRQSLVQRDGQPEAQGVDPDSFRLERFDGRSDDCTAMAGEAAAHVGQDRDGITARLAAARSLAEQWARRPFDLACDLMIRAALVQLGDTEYLLCTTLHHIAADGWSLGILSKDLSRLYQARVTGLADRLEPLPLSYSDYAAWQREMLAEEGRVTDVAYWRERLAGAPAMLELPTDFTRPQVVSHEGARLQVQVPRDLMLAVQDLSRRVGVTEHTTLLAVFQVLLMRYSKQRDVCVGVPVTGRSDPRLQSLVGLFVNTVVMRADLEGNPRLSDFLTSVARTAAEAYEHAGLPFDQVLQSLRLGRNAAHHPLFQTMFALHHVEPAELRLEGIHAEPLAGDLHVAMFDLTLGLFARHDGYRGMLEYRSDLFAQESMRAFVDHFLHLLRQVTLQPEQSVEELELVTPAERARLLVEWNDTEHPFAEGDCTLHALVEAQAQRTPEAVALVDAATDLEVTYRELSRWSDTFARHLLTRGVAPGAPVGLWAERCPEAIVAILGIWKAGCHYVPAPMQAPQERQRMLLEDARVEHVVAIAAPEWLCQSRRWTLHTVDRADWASLPPATERAEPIATEQDTTCDSDALAYILYTSGTTGVPKGVQIRHRGIANLVLHRTRRRWRSDDFRLTPLTSPLDFDGSLVQFLSPLITGGALVIFRDFNALGESPWYSRLTVLTGASSMIASLVRQYGLPASTRVVGLGAEPASVELLEALLASPQLDRILTGYGVTECSCYSTDIVLYDRDGRSEIPRDEQQQARPVGRGAATAIQAAMLNSIGRPVANTRVYLLDGRGQLLPRLVPGEIYLGGVGVGEGYWDREELTKERFLPDPFETEPGARIYRTGDLARWRADGSLEFLGRIDRQVKLRGYRIELGEIESALAMHPRVGQTTVLLREDRPGSPRLVAYVVPLLSGTPLPMQELRELLASRLPEYMVPDDFLQLDALPLTANGKIDRKALPVPDGVATHPKRTIAPPRTETERTLVRIWADLLGIEGVGIDENFFELGGHSLLAARAVARVRDEFHAELTLRAFLECGSVAALAPLVDAARNRRTEDNEAILATDERPVLSFAQERLWFLQQYSPGATPDVVPLLYRLAGPLHLSALQQAIASIVRRHVAFRTCVRAEDGVPRPYLEERPELDVVLVDLQHRTVEGDPAAVIRQAEREAQDASQESFDLTQAPLLRVRIWRLGEREHLLLLVAHHVALDGWSTGLLCDELADHYAAAVRGEVPLIAAPAFSYGDYAAWQRRRASAGAWHGDLEYWRHQLRELPASLELPTDLVRPPRVGHAGDSVRVHLPPPLANGVRQLARQSRCTPFVVLLSAFQTLLMRYTGQEDFAVGVPVAGRERTEWESVLGLFVNTLVMRGNLSGDPTFRELIARTQATVTEGLAHQQLPFEQLVEAIQPPRDPARTPLFQVLFQLMDFPAKALRLEGLDAAPVRLPFRHARFDLELHLSHGGDEYTGELVYRTDLFHRATIERLARHWMRLLQAALDQPDTIIGKLPLLEDAERQSMMIDRNQTRVPYPAHTVHRQFEITAAGNRERTALVFGHTSWTYGQLDDEATRIARLLRTRGVGAGDRVGIACGRGFACIAGMLGILKAGAAYVPFDRHWPDERTSKLIEAAGIRAMVTSAENADRYAFRNLEVMSVDGVNLEMQTKSLRDSIAAAMESASDLGDERCDADWGDPLTPESPAYVLFTSGSTGHPKGVEVPHRAILRLLMGVDYARLAQDTVLLQLAPVTFDASTFEIWGPLLHGGTLVIPQDGPLDPRGIAALVAMHRVTTLWLTASLFNQLVDDRPEALAGVKEVLTGGESLSVEHIRRAQRVLGLDVTLVNGYGPTECTTFACCYRIPHGVSAETRTIPIGRPIANTTAYVLDRFLQPVPDGVTGELYLGGDGLALGYLDDEARSRERFVPHPVEGAPALVYRTGDLARWNGEGDLEFVGRSDCQIKVRGFRVEPAEVEAALERHPRVLQAAVGVREVAGEGHSAVDRRLFAMVVPSDEQVSLTGGELRSHLRRILPDYLVPSEFACVRELPCGEQGKLDRHRLPAAFIQASASSLSSASRRDPSPREQAASHETQPAHGSRAVAALVPPLVSLWSELLRREVIDPHENFFDAGGHSLLAVQLVARIEKHFGRSLPLACLYERGSIMALAEQLASPATDKPASLVPLRVGAADGPRLYVAPNLGGGVSIPRSLVHRLDPRFSVFAVQPGPETEVPEASADFNSLIHRYARELLEAQPTGAYRLMGYCFGGNVAYEVARLLVEAGRTVDWLMLIDAPPRAAGGGAGVLAADWKERLARVGRVLANLPRWLRDDLLQSGPRELSVRVRRRVRYWLRRGGRHRVSGWGPAIGEDEAGESYLDAVMDLRRLPPASQRMHRRNFQAFSESNTQPAELKVILLRARTRGLLQGLPDDLGWRSFALRGVEVVTVAGHHKSVLESSHVEQTAQAVNRLLRSLAEK